jgi:probable phosphoglycerate mutase
VNIYLVRHGEAAAHWHESDDPGLSDRGRRQAEEAARLLQERVDAGIRLLSSPMRRARETSQPLAGVLGAEVAIAEPFREIPTPVQLADRQTWLGRIARQAWDEQVDLVRDWRDGLLHQLRRIHEPTVVFTHFMVLNAIVGDLTSDQRVVCFMPDNASITTLRRERGELRLVELGRQFRTEVR